MPENDLRSLLIWHQQALLKIQQLEEQVSQAWKEYCDINGNLKSPIIRWLHNLNVQDSQIIKTLIAKGEYRCQRDCSSERKAPLHLVLNKSTTYIEVEVVQELSPSKQLVHEEIIVRLLLHPLNDLES